MKIAYCLALQLITLLFALPVLFHQAFVVVVVVVVVFFFFSVRVLQSKMSLPHATCDVHP